MEKPISLRIWAPNLEGQTRQFNLNWDDSTVYDVLPEPNINGDIDYIVEAKDGFEIYRGVFNSLRYRSRDYCIIVEMRIASGYVLVRQNDKLTLVSPGALLREILAHITDNYLKESFGKYKYRDEEHVVFEAARIQNILAPYTTVNTWGKRVQMSGDKRPFNVQASTASEADAVLLAIPTATSVAECSEIVVGDFKSGGAMAQDVKSDPACKRIFVRCERQDGTTRDNELTETPMHLTLKDFGLDPEVYQELELVIDKANVMENFRLDKNEFFPHRGVKVTLYPSQQRVSVTLTPEEKSQDFDYQVSVKGVGEVTEQLKNSVLFRNEPLKGHGVKAVGARLKKFIHSTPDELKALFTLPNNSEYTVESVRLNGNTVSIRVEMRPEYAEMWRRRQMGSQSNGSRNQTVVQGEQQAATNNVCMLDVDCPLSNKKNAVDVRIVFAGNGMRIVEQFMADITDGRIRQSINMPNTMRATIELGSPAKFTAALHEDPRKNENKLTVGHWAKVNPFKRFCRRFYYRYDDNRSYWTRFGVIFLLCLALMAGGFALGAAFYPGIKAAVEEYRQESRQPEPLGAQPETTNENQEPVEAENSAADAVEKEIKTPDVQPTENIAPQEDDLVPVPEAKAPNEPKSKPRAATKSVPDNAPEPTQKDSK